MGTYVPTTPKEQQEMLKEIGYNSLNALFAHIPEEVKLKDGLNIPDGMSEMEVKDAMENMADKNKVFKHIFRGAGAYNHYIPAIVKSVVSKEEFLTAYTPYQAEISQGNLQAIFEFQTMICELTGMEAANASVYDGATAGAEALFMCQDRKKTKFLVSAGTSPQTIETMKTYCYGRNTEITLVPTKDGETDKEALKEMLSDETACFFLQQPNYFGVLEDAKAIGEIVHEAGAKYIMSCHPISLALIQTPGECGADAAVGEGQPLGMPLSFGGPYLGFMAATSKMLRKLPGRIVGETVDSEGKRGYVLTLQAREQHIRREKASSNICSNQALCALTASVYMAAMGQKGMEQAAVQCMSKAAYLQKKLEGVGFELKYKKPFFNEFVTDCPISTGELLKALEGVNFLGGLPLENNEILWCATEKNSKDEIDHLIGIIEEVCGE